MKEADIRMIAEGLSQAGLALQRFVGAMRAFTNGKIWSFTIDRDLTERKARRRRHIVNALNRTKERS